jgi:hypothetical protein
MTSPRPTMKLADLRHAPEFLESRDPREAASLQRLQQPGRDHDILAALQLPSMSSTIFWIGRGLRRQQYHGSSAGKTGTISTGMPAMPR